MAEVNGLFMGQAGIITEGTCLIHYISKPMRVLSATPMGNSNFTLCLLFVWVWTSWSCNFNRCCTKLIETDLAGDTNTNANFSGPELCDPDQSCTQSPDLKSLVSALVTIANVFKISPLLSSSEVLVRVSFVGSVFNESCLATFLWRLGKLAGPSTLYFLN